MKSYETLKSTFSQLSELSDIRHIMNWDEAVMMPEGAGEARAQSLATLDCMMQKILVSKKNKKLIATAKQESSLSTWDEANLMWMEKEYMRATCIPLKLTEKLTKQTFACEQAWRKLRATNNWREYLPLLKQNLKLVKEVTKRRAAISGLSLYDELLDQFAPGFNQAQIDTVFAGLKSVLPDLIQKIMQKQSQEKRLIPEGPFSIAQQEALGRKVMQALQFDFKHGRLDISHHPFCGGSPTDTRITTRYNTHEFLSSMMGICHETGHGLYEQGLPKEWLQQPVGRVHSMAMHESQSLLLEMQVCRSPAFYEFLTPIIQEIFGQQPALTADNLYQLMTLVKPDYIRVDADEVTYPLHIILRYDIEKDLFNDELKIQDLPARWHELMMKYFNISTKGNHKDGVMQDVHWAAGAFGYFPAYTLGRLIAAQLFATFSKSAPHFFADVKAGDFSQLKNWLRANIYSKASSVGTQELLRAVTGKELDSQYFIEHIKARY